MIGAADTFRAAAGEQLETWAERAGADFVGSQSGADPAAVVFDASPRRRPAARDVVIVDTAGRLHTKGNLMDELRKIHRVIGQRIEGAPHEVLLTIDATTGQNGLPQARLFAEAVAVTGIVLTKLDGTAKGGIVLAIAHELGIPVKLVGVGEGIEDLRPFDPEDFAARPLRGRRERLAAFGACSTRSADRLGAHARRPARPGAAEREGHRRAMREIRLALLEADVNFGVVKEFVAAVKERALGAEVIAEPDAGPAGHQDRPRGADDAHGDGRVGAHDSRAGRRP